MKRLSEFFLVPKLVDSLLYILLDNLEALLLSLRLPLWILEQIDEEHGFLKMVNKIMVDGLLWQI